MKDSQVNEWELMSEFIFSSSGERIDDTILRSIIIDYRLYDLVNEKVDNIRINKKDLYLYNLIPYEEIGNLNSEDEEKPFTTYLLEINATKVDETKIKVTFTYDAKYLYLINEKLHEIKISIDDCRRYDLWNEEKGCLKYRI